MNWLRHNLRGAVLLAGALALAVEAWSLSQTRQQAALALAGFEQERQERDGLARQSPALSPVNEQAIIGDLAQAGKVLAELHVALQGPDPEITAPGKPIDAYFD